MTILVFITFSCNKSRNEPVKVELKKVNGKYRLYREGKPYYVKGAGLEFGNIKSLADRGANSFRTWRTENGQQSAKEILDEAYKYGLTVTMGLEIGRERHGFDYNNIEQVEKQFEYIKNEVLKYKDHPALLAWGIGNELNLHYTNEKVWSAVNNISKMIHEIDGNHPTTTMLAGIGKNEVDLINRLSPDLDFISIQMYGDIDYLNKKIEEAGYEGPYLVTEWGATGHWEVDTTSWGIQIEQTSTEKSEALIRRWNNSIYNNKTHCLGSYVFLWGQKQERTPTWYGFFLEAGEQIEQVGTMQFLWTGKWPEKRAPGIKEIKLNNKTSYDNIILKPGEDLILNLNVINHSNDSLRLRAEILPDITNFYGDGGDFEKRPESIQKIETETLQDSLNFVAPSDTGPYRIFLYVLDNYNQAATANIPFYVRDEALSQ